VNPNQHRMPVGRVLVVNFVNFNFGNLHDVSSR
jgi:hypothetical protein